ncbi:hypothetical protein [Paramicrobacterium chengjingii]|uniref:Uncharacterized protein n=1 Tax=Paramicrobacterium chengjingii TaxID=2769067 RepID=A0ABX6YG70_9MICO|nr:hypothetical protein [Microbacterium chengjingii]QPZ37798.1 hypothetical protein HCR76_13385 [Microbacterium chengjingii]
MSTEPSSPDRKDTDGTEPAESLFSQPETGSTAPFASEPTYRPQSGSGPDAAATASTRRAPIFGTIFWGIILLVFAVVMAVLAIPTITVDVVALTITALVVLGALLVVAGVAASVRNRRN